MCRKFLSILTLHFSKELYFTMRENCPNTGKYKPELHIWTPLTQLQNNGALHGFKHSFPLRKIPLLELYTMWPNQLQVFSQHNTPDPTQNFTGIISLNCTFIYDVSFAANVAFYMHNLIIGCRTFFETRQSEFSVLSFS